MPNNKLSGESGEDDVIIQVVCPNCGKRLQKLPPAYPLYDLQCSGCKFRVQVKTNISKPKKEIFGATWDILSKTLKAGEQVPPLIVYFKWLQWDKIHTEIRFYPFIPRANLRKRVLPPKGRNANLKMFNYIGLDKLPYFKWSEKAKRWESHIERPG